MSKPASYPFLAIANKYGIDYATVLKVADNMKRNSGATLHPYVGLDAFTEIHFATEEQQAIRDGAIDWQTGEAL